MNNEITKKTISFKNKKFYLISGLLVLLILFFFTFSFILNRNGKFLEKMNFNLPTFRLKQKNPSIIDVVNNAFLPEKAKEITALIEKAENESNEHLKYSYYQSAWNRMLAVYYYSGRKTEQRKALEQLKEILEKYPLYKEQDYEIK